MAVFAQTLFAFVRSHLMSFAFFSAWHFSDKLMNPKLFFLPNLIFYLSNKGFSRLKRRDKMLRDNDGGVF